MKKNTISRFVIFSVLIISAGLVTRCERDPDPETTVTTPKATTGAASFIGQGWATLNGRVNANNDNTDIFFEFGTTEEYDTTYDASLGPYGIVLTPKEMVTGIIDTSVSINVFGLTKNTTYHFRVKAVNSKGTTYGVDGNFTTTNPVSTVIEFNPDVTYGTLTDINGNIYKTVQIGSQTWMAENLRTTKYKDGKDIPYYPGISYWGGLTSDAYSWYNNDSIVYGCLYNWYAVNTGKLCPTGWHVPTDFEWAQLTSFLGGEAVAGYKLKEKGTDHWPDPNSNATNETGFTALPGGYRSYFGAFMNITNRGYWWSATQSSANDAFCRSLRYSYDNIDKSASHKKSGFYIRCVKD